MTQFSQSHKKILVVGLIVIVCFCLLWFFIFIPSKKKVTDIQLELLAIQEKIGQIEKIAGPSQTIDRGIKDAKARYQRLNSLFPDKEEEALKQLSHLAKKYNIEIISLNPHEKKLCSAGLIDDIEGKKCHRVFVSMQIRAFYKGLVGYIEALKESLPAFISIETLKIRKFNPAVQLDVLLEFNVYFLS